MQVIDFFHNKLQRIHKIVKQNSRVFANPTINFKEKSSKHFNFNGIKDGTLQRIQFKKKTFRDMMPSKAKHEIPWVT